MERAPALSTAVGRLTVIRAKVSDLEVWVKRVGLGKELSRLNTELDKIDSILSTYSHSLENWCLLRNLFFTVEDLVDQLEYYHLSEIVKQREKDPEVISIKSGWASNLLSKLRRSSFPISIPKGSLANSMNELAVLLQQAGNNVRNTLKSERFGSDAVPIWNIQLVKPIKTMRHSLVSESRVFGRDNEMHCLIKTMRSSRLSESRVFGRGKEIDYLIELLTGHEDADTAVSVVSIVGAGGLGKTTLAQLVYNDSRVKNHFEEHLWVTGFGSSEDVIGNSGVVFGNSDLARVACEMMQQVSGDSQPKMENLDELHEKLANSLGSKRFLIVMDDVWIENDVSWESLLAPFKQRSVRGSKILVTTRMHSVARIVGSSETIYLHGLEDEVFWNFFKSIILDDEWFRRNRNFEIIGRQIVKRLKGNPLALKAVGAFLKRDLDETHWQSIVESEEWDLEDGILPALNLSYNHLPSNLKQCFKYFSLFPKGYHLNREHLINLWIAEGFICSKGRRLADVASEYFDTFLDRGFLQRVVKDRPTPGYRSSLYVIHELIHDLAISVSSDECLVLDLLSHKEAPITVRRLSVIPKFLNGSNPSLELGSVAVNLRALIFLGNEYREEQIVTEQVKSSIKVLKFLRVLTLDATLNSLSLLTEIANFTLLRYLDLKMEYLETLPGDICKLYHLNFLDISHCRRLRELPKKFNNLVNLRHLVADTRVYSMIAGVSKLTSLQELREFRVKIENEFGIDQLRNLKDLRGSLRICSLINVKSKEEANEARLYEKFLNCLTLSWDRKGPDLTALQFIKEEKVLEGLHPHSSLKSLNIIGYAGSIVPIWLSNNIITSLVNLVCFSLEDCSGLETLPPLGELPFLKQLHLKSMPRVDEIGNRLYGSKNHVGFQSLEIMIIEDMPALEIWHWSERNPLLFHILQVLEIKNCPKLRELPLSNSDSIKAEGNVRFRCLRSLVINACPKVEKLPPLPHTHRLSYISINGLGLLGEFYLSIFRGELQLKIYSNHNVSSLDEVLVFYNLRNLRSLCIKRCPNLRSLSWEHVCSLVWLNSLHIEECPVISRPSQKSLSNLKTLKIVNCRNLPSFPDSLHTLTWVNKLKLTGCESIQSLPKKGFPPPVVEFNVVIPDQYLPKKGLQLHSYLKYLDIYGYGGDNIQSRLVNVVSVCLEDCMGMETLPPLGELPFLKKLHLKSMPRIRELGLQFYGSNHDMRFQSLQILVIEDMLSLEVWHWVGGPLLFHALQVLEIKNCPKLHYLPLSNSVSIEAEGNVRFRCLRSLVIYQCCPLVENLLSEQYRPQHLFLNNSLEPHFRNLSSLPNSLHRLDSLHRLNSLHRLDGLRRLVNLKYIAINGSEWILTMHKGLPIKFEELDVVKQEELNTSMPLTIKGLDESILVELDRPLPKRDSLHLLKS